MERGIVKLYDKNGGMGIIGRVSDSDVRFYAQSIIGKDRVHLAQGDAVWFQVDNIQILHTAINVRKCN